jgi:hypothetical protein
VRIWRVLGVHSVSIIGVFHVLLGCLGRVFKEYLDNMHGVFVVHLGCSWNAFGAYFVCIQCIFVMYLMVCLQCCGVHLGVSGVHFECVDGIFSGVVSGVFGVYWEHIHVFIMYLVCIWYILESIRSASGMYYGCIWGAFTHPRPPGPPQATPGVKGDGNITCLVDPSVPK